MTCSIRSWWEPSCFIWRQVMAFNRKQKLRDNIEAVRTAFTLDRERRTPTERERALPGALLRLRGPEVHPEPGKGTVRRRALGEVRPRTVRPDGGAAPHHPGEQPG